MYIFRKPMVYDFKSWITPTVTKRLWHWQGAKWNKRVYWVETHIYVMYPNIIMDLSVPLLIKIE